MLYETHVRDCLPPSFDPHQFTYRANRSEEDAVSTALHTALCHLENPGTYDRMLFIDYSSAFNTIIYDILVDKLPVLVLPQDQHKGCVISPHLSSGVKSTYIHYLSTGIGTGVQSYSVKS